jgi:hypothetical protein
MIHSRYLTLESHDSGQVSSHSRSIIQIRVMDVAEPLFRQGIGYCCATDSSKVLDISELLVRPGSGYSRTVIQVR